MVLQTRNRLFWPGMRQELDDHFTQCKACTENRIGHDNLVENFFQGVGFKVILQREVMKISWSFDVKCLDSCKSTRHATSLQSKPCWNWGSGMQTLDSPWLLLQTGARPSEKTMRRSVLRWVCVRNIAVHIIHHHSLGSTAQWAVWSTCWRGQQTWTNCICKKWFLP